MKFRNVPALILGILLLSSCTTVTVSNMPLPHVIKKLRETNTRSISLKVPPINFDPIIGHQYLLVILPFGRIRADNPEISVYNKAATRLALNGYKVIPPGPGIPLIKISLDKLQLTAYDLLIMRQIYCSAEVSFEQLDSGGRSRRSDSTRAVVKNYKPFAFSRELNHVYEQCLEQAVNRVLNGI